MTGAHKTIRHFACNFANCSPILKILLPANRMIKFILKWLLNKFFHLKCAAQLPCNLSLNTFFALSLNYDISISQGDMLKVWWDISI